MNSPSSRKGFTLIELLVVMGVITVLIGILLPALGTTRYVTQDLRCKVQVRSVGQALVHYLVDHAEFFPFPQPHPGTSPLVVNQDVKTHLDPYLDSDEIDTAKRTKPWCCPLDNDFYTYTGSSYYYYAGHYRYLFEVDTPPGYTKMKIMTAYEKFPTMQIYGDANRLHRGKINYSLIDGAIVTH